MKESTEKRPLRKRRAFRALLWTLLILLVLILVAPSAALAVFLNRHIDYLGEETPRYAMQGIYSAAEFGLTETVHTLKTADGESLWCAEIEAEQPRGVVIYLTGIAQPSVTYFYGHAAMLREQGFASFLLEVRGHGNSSGSQIGFGYTETPDVRAAVDYILAQERYAGLPIMLHGVSLGGAIALNAFGQIPEIAGCIAMSPFASCETELELLLEQYHVPAFLRAVELPLLRQTLKWIYGAAAVEELRPDRQIQNAGARPVFLIGCREDTAVPVESTERLQAVWPAAEVWIRDSWEHFVVKNCDLRHVAEDTEYCGKILAWMDATVAGAKTE